MKKGWFLAGLAILLILSPGMTCSPYRMYGFLADSSIMIEPTPTVVHNDSLRVSITLRMEKTRPFKRNYMVNDFYLRVTDQEQKIGSITIPVRSSKSDRLFSEVIHISLPVEVDFEGQRGSIEVASRLINPKNRSFRELPRLGIGEVFPDSASFNQFFDSLTK